MQTSQSAEGFLLEEMSDGKPVPKSHSPEEPSGQETDPAQGTGLFTSHSQHREAELAPLPHRAHAMADFISQDVCFEGSGARASLHQCHRAGSVHIHWAVPLKMSEHPSSPSALHSQPAATG